MNTAQSVILRAQVALNDNEGVRWPADELVRYLNDAQREIVRRDSLVFCSSLPQLP